MKKPRHKTPSSAKRARSASGADEGDRQDKGRWSSRRKTEAIENAVYELKAVNPNRKAEVDTRTPADLLDLIGTKGVEIAAALDSLRSLVGRSP